MRTQLVIAVAALCAAWSLAEADPAKAKAANTAGYKLHKKKKYKEAAVEYRKAIAEDPNHVLAHYNLACVASLLEDHKTAVEELAWVMDRASWDPAAKAAYKKVPKDKDLRWVLETVQGKRALDDNSLNSVTEQEEAFGLSAPTNDPSVTKALAGGDKHEAKCSAAVVAWPIKMRGSKFFKSTVAVSPREGVAVIDPAGKVTHRSEPLGCNDAKDTVTFITNGHPALHSFDDISTPVDDQELITVVMSRGADEAVTLFMPKDKQLVRVFDAVYKAGGKTGDVATTPLGNLVYTAPGEKKPRVFRFDTTAFKYVE